MVIPKNKLIFASVTVLLRVLLSAKYPMAGWWEPILMFVILALAFQGSE